MITVEDNGKGFNPALLNDAAGVGLGNVKNRVEFLRGEMKIESVAKEGTSIHIEVQVMTPDAAGK